MNILSPLKRTIAQRALIRALVRRELSARYRGGALGFLWSFVNPLCSFSCTRPSSLVFAPRASAPLRALLFGGVLVWGFVSSSLSTPSTRSESTGRCPQTTVAPEVFPAAAVGRGSRTLLALPVLAAAIALRARGSIRPGPSLAFRSCSRPRRRVRRGAHLLGARGSFGDVRDVVANLLTLFFVTPSSLSGGGRPRWRWLLWPNRSRVLLGSPRLALLLPPIAPADWLRMAAWAAVCDPRRRRSSGCATRSRRRA